MKNVILAFLCLLMLGCTSAVIPSYLPDTRPYTERVPADHERTLTAVRQALSDLGWDIEQTVDPYIYEKIEVLPSDHQASLIMTGIRQTPLFIGTRYAKMNVYVHSREDVSDIEIRYLTVTSMPFKNWTSYSNDSAVQRIMEYIRSLLGSEVS